MVVPSTNNYLVNSKTAGCGSRITTQEGKSHIRTCYPSEIINRYRRIFIREVTPNCICIGIGLVIIRVQSFHFANGGAGMSANERTIFIRKSVGVVIVQIWIILCTGVRLYRKGFFGPFFTNIHSFNGWRNEMPHIFKTCIAER